MRRITFGLMCGVALIIGCGGGSSGPQFSLVPVTGIVTANGQPVANAVVSFAPYEGDIVRSAYGVTDDSGKYALQYEGRDGCPPGKYRVTVSKFAMPDGSPFPRGMPPEEQTAEGIEHVSKEFSDAEQTKLYTEVTNETKDIPFEVTLKK